VHILPRPGLARRRHLSWIIRYQLLILGVDVASALLAGVIALAGRFSGAEPPSLYVGATGSLPVVWAACVAMAGGYDARFIGLGSEEFRRVLNAAVSLTAAIAIFSYALKFDIARGYVLIALPVLALTDITARYAVRKQLHQQRFRGRCMRRVTAVGHAGAVADLIARLRHDQFHGLEVVNACLADQAGRAEIGGVPVLGGLPDAARVAAITGADTVAVLTCPEMDGRWSLDEFPQLFNVLLGEMSLIGPRPPLPCEAARYGDDVRRRLVVKPGMTGLWQVSGRSDLSREDAVRLDLRYVENWSLALDLQILWKTCSAVIKGRGAY
jgi:hypothetical protein